MVCGSSSRFVHVTVVPTGTVSIGGVNLNSLIPTVAGPAAGAGDPQQPHREHDDRETCAPRSLPRRPRRLHGFLLSWLPSLPTRRRLDRSVGDKTSASGN